MPTAAQVHQALINTQQKPRNHAQLIYQAIQNDEDPDVTSIEAFYMSNEVREDGQSNYTLSGFKSP